MQDYRFLEMELLANYSAQNWYCYTIDARAKPLFKLRLRALARCFPNVLVSAKHFPMDSAGHFTSDALMECARELAKPTKSWHYLITLQNHDIQIKSNLEMADRLAMLDGANDIEFGENNKFTRQRLQFYLDHYKWSFDALKILKDGQTKMHLFKVINCRQWAEKQRTIWPTAASQFVQGFDERLAEPCIR